MKKIFLFAAGVALSASAGAQRLSLYEEFSGENCGPCAVANPGLWSLVTTPGNESKILLIKYQSPIPTAGPIYLENPQHVYDRLMYYSVPFAPYGRLNGVAQAGASPGSVTYLKQTDIDAAAAAATSFSISIPSVNYNFKGDSVTAEIKVDCIAAFSGALTLHVGILEHMVFATPPGTNGEKEFHNVVREMYPSSAGTAMPATWTVGMSQTFTVTGKMRSFIKKPSAPKMVAWIQKDADKAVLQAGLSAALPSAPYTNDIAATPISSPKNLECTGKTITGATITLKNPGTTAATSATIYYRAGTGAWSSQAWTGSLAPGATTSVTLGPITLPSTGGIYNLTDSVDFAGERNILDNVQNSTITVAATAGVAAYSTDFESGIPTGFYFYDSDKSGNTWVNGYGGTGSTYSHSGIYMPWFKLTDYPTGTSSIMIVPTPTVSANTVLEFWEAYAQMTSSSNDKLEVVYSKDCGVTWTSMWSAVGTAHATTTPTTTFWLPSRTKTGDWVKRSINLSSLPAGSILGIRATDGGGNNQFIDDISVRNIPTSIKEEVQLNSFSVSPNPANEFTNISFNLTESTNVKVMVVDAMGRTVVTAADMTMSSGVQEMKVNTSSLSTGMYLIKIVTASGTTTEKLSVIK